MSKAEELANAMGFNGVAERVAGQVVKGLREQFDAQRMTADERRAIAALVEEFQVYVSQRTPELITAIAEEMCRIYTPEEVDTLIGFYNSDVGRSIAAKHLAILDANQVVGGEWGMRVATEFGAEERLTKIFGGDAG